MTLQSLLIRILVLIGFILESHFGSFLCKASGRSKMPNVVILLADDLGYGDLGSYGNTMINTPTLDNLAKEGMRFTDFYAGSCVCSPSRSALMTGQFPLRTGIYSWIHHSHKMHLLKDKITLPELLKNSGYNTAHFGKWHLSNDYKLRENTCHGTPGNHGFDYWFATGNNANPSHHNPNNFIRNGQNTGTIEGYSSHIVVDEAVGWLDQNRDKTKPFFINCWFHEPHYHVAAPCELNEKYQQTKLPAYYGCIENMDLAIGNLLKKLESIGEADNTIVIFMSDNGSYLDDGNNGRLKGRKAMLWEGGIRVPGIIRWPGKIDAGITVNTPAGIVDILPTICEITGSKLPDESIIDGTNLTPLFKGKSLSREKPLYWFYPPSRPGPLCVIRDGDWCLTADPELEIPQMNRFNEEWIGLIKKSGLKNFHLYNLREDPEQKYDVSRQNQHIYSDLKKMMLTLHKEIVDEALDWRYFECK